MLPGLIPYFDQFIENISLGNPQVPRMNSAARTITDFLVSSYGIHEQDVFLQGSYANGTAIEPVHGGEYDVDLVAICATPAHSAEEALDDLEARFRSDGRFRDRVTPKKPCIRLEYAEDDVGEFHVDVVPVRLSGLLVPPLESPRRGTGWRATAPAEYTQWCHEQGVLYLRTAKMLKRWRSDHQATRTAIKSIVLQVLIAEYMPQVQDDSDRLTQTLQAMHSALAGLTSPPTVSNPVLISENLASSWSNESFASFVSELSEALEYSLAAAAATDIVEAVDAWREIFGDDFPAALPEAFGIALGDLSHAQTPIDRGWTEGLNSAYGVTVSAETQRGRRGQLRSPYPSNGPLIFAGHRIRFKAHITAPNHVSVWWQVANTGAHAREQSGLRGDIFKARDMEKRELRDETENWESSSYTGSHVIRALLVRDNRLVASSAWFTVNIYSKGFRFRF